MANEKEGNYYNDNFCDKKGVIFMTSTNVLVSIGFIGVGALLFVSGIRKSIKCSGRTVGRITGVHETQETDDEGFNHYYYSPEFEYVVNGQIYRGTGNKSYTKRKKIQIGGSINVYYNPQKPYEHFTKGGGFILPFVGIMLIIVGVLCIVTAQNA